MAEEKPDTQSASILEKAKDAVTAVKEKVVEIKDDMLSEEHKAIASEFKEAGMSKIQQIMHEIPNSMGLISKSGYEFNGISVTLGLPPDIVSSFQYRKDISENERSALLEEAKDKKILNMVLKCLFKAGDFSHTVKMKDYKLEDVTVTLGIMPGVTVNFRKK